MRKIIFGGKEKPAEPVVPASEKIRAEIGEISKSLTELHSWLEDLKNQRDAVLRSALKTPVDAVQKLIMLDGWINTGGIVRSYLAGVLDDLRGRYKNAASWEPMNAARTQRLEAEQAEQAEWKRRHK